MPTTTLSTLRTYLRDQWGSKATTQADREFDRIINQAIRKIAGDHHWSYFWKEGAIGLTAPYSTGTVAVTAGSTTVTGTGTTWTSAMTGQRIVISPESNQEYEFTFVGTTSGTISPAWVGATASGRTYNIYFGSYSMPADFRTLDEEDLEDRFWVRYLTPQEFMMEKLNWREEAQQPLFFTIVGERKLLLYPYPDQAQMFRFGYYRNPTAMANDGDTMDWPDERLELVFAAIDMHASKKRHKYYVRFPEAMAAYREELEVCRGLDFTRKKEVLHWRSSLAGIGGAERYRWNMMRRGPGTDD